MLKPRMILAAVAAAVMLWLGSGVYIVGPGEQGVVRRFGKEYAITGPGLRYHLPRPIESRDVVDVARVRRAEIGFRTEESGRARVKEEESLMLTGDENIVSTQLFVQYVIKEPAAFVFRVRDPEQVLRTAAEVTLRSAVGRNTIDFTMTDGRFQVQEQIKQHLQQLLDAYQTGILVTEARLLEVDPPQAVQDAFHDVVRAWEDRERLIQEARGFTEDIVPRSRGEAAEVIRKAEGYKEQRVIRAQGEAKRFLEVAAAYAASPVVTRERLYLEALERILPGVEKIVLPAQAAGTILPWLPLRSLQTPAPASPTAQPKGATP
jgi:membrane protease subunit HflK